MAREHRGIQRKRSRGRFWLIRIDVQVLIVRARGQETPRAGPTVDVSTEEELSGSVSIPERIHTASMAPKLIHDVQIVDPFLGPVNTPETGIWREFPAFAAPEAIVQRVLHRALLPCVSPSLGSAGDHHRGWQ